MQKRLETSKFLNISLLALLLAGCGSAADNSAPAPAPETPPTTYSYYVYVASSVAETVSVYSIDTSTGALTSVGPSVVTRRNPQAITIDPLHRFAYVANGGSDSISTYRIDTNNGALIPLPGAVSVGDFPVSIAVGPSGEFAYVANRYSNNISAYSIDLNTGWLNLVNTYETVAYTRSIAIEPMGRYLYVVSGTTTPSESGGAKYFGIDPSSGELSGLASVSYTGIGTFAIAVDPTGRFACQVDGPYFSTGGLACRTISASGVLTGGAFADTGPHPRGVAFDPTGKFVYVANSSLNTVSAYRVAYSSPVVPINEVSTEVSPQSVAVDPTGKFVYVANTSSDSISIYRIDATTGGLTHEDTVATDSGPISITTFAIPQ